MMTQASKGDAWRITILKRKKIELQAGKAGGAPPKNAPSAPALVVSLQLSSLGAAYFFSGAGRFSLL
jgi:hypothetical protein